MGRYKKGLNTCNDIVTISKKFFYEKGYSQTTIQEICDECNITLGNFTYYFKTKQDLLRRIYQDYVSNIVTFINSNVNSNLNSLEKFVLTSFVYYYNILEDDISLHFHYKVLKNHSLYAFMSNELLDNLYTPFIKEFDLGIDQKELEILYLCDFGARRELTIKHIEDNVFSSKIDFCLKSCIMTARLFKIQDDLIIECLKTHKELLKSVDVCNINLLK